MLGDFFEHNKFIHPNYYNWIEDGTPIVSMGRFSPYYQFGIFYKGRVVLRKYDFIKKISYCQIVSFDIFHDNGSNEIYEYVPINFFYDKHETLVRAMSVDFKSYENGYYSVVGDDFVFWCLVGDNFDDFFLNSKMGKHYKERYKEIGILSFSHHAIAIEQDYIIHFSEDNGQFKKPHIIIDDFDTLNSPQQVLYINDSLEQRYCARNRALYVWASGNDFEGYNFFRNNCEHFATFCKTGECKSSQIRQGWMDLGILALTALTKRPNRAAINAIKRYVFK